ncbi:MAG: cobalamin-dependent protein [Planctomycetes bacterium]|nr:cobalamin-dependent protein [Planctomycetota bacterium]
MTDTENPLFGAYFKALMEGDRKACRQILEEQINGGVEPLVIYTEFFTRSLHRVGLLWERNQISVAREHIASLITEELLALFHPRIFSIPKNEHRALVACSPNEYHQIGGRIVADYMELQGWDTTFVGASTPLPDLMDAIALKQPELVGLSTSLSFNLPSLLKALETIREVYPAIHLLAGGQAFSSDVPERVRQLSLPLSSLSELRAYLENFPPVRL